MELKGKNVTIMGAGGAARAIAFALASQGANITIIDRNLERAKELASDIEKVYGKPESGVTEGGTNA